MKIAALLAAVMIPLTSPAGWQELKFSRIKANTNTFGPPGLEVAVDHSSSPLIFPLKEPVQVTSFEAVLEIEGDMRSVSGSPPEDAYLRLGLVAPGERRLNRFERMIATDWVKRLFALAPKGSGVDKIHFFTLSDRDLGRSRKFPGSKGLMVERIIAVRDPGTRNFMFAHKLEVPLLTTALWLSVDGDDTQSTYTLRLKSLTLNP